MLQELCVTLSGNDQTIQSVLEVLAYDAQLGHPIAMSIVKHSNELEPYWDSETETFGLYKVHGKKDAVVLYNDALEVGADLEPEDLIQYLISHCDGLTITGHYFLLDVGFEAYFMVQEGVLKEVSTDLMETYLETMMAQPQEQQLADFWLGSYLKKFFDDHLDETLDAYDIEDYLLYELDMAMVFQAILDKAFATGKDPLD